MCVRSTKPASYWFANFASIHIHIFFRCRTDITIRSHKHARALDRIQWKLSSFYMRTTSMLHTIQLFVLRPFEVRAKICNRCNINITWRAWQDDSGLLCRLQGSLPAGLAGLRKNSGPCHHILGHFHVGNASHNFECYNYDLHGPISIVGFFSVRTNIQKLCLKMHLKCLNIENCVRCDTSNGPGQNSRSTFLWPDIATWRMFRVYSFSFWPNNMEMVDHRTFLTVLRTS